jgi:hypothetical protein
MAALTIIFIRVSPQHRAESHRAWTKIYPREMKCSKRDGGGSPIAAPFTYRGMQARTAMTG